jgi:hypothetical protein
VSSRHLERIASATLHIGDCLDVLPQLAADSFHAIVTDPPAGISFMGRDWDGDKGGRDHWIAWMQQVATECLRVCKPGAHALVWALPRTSHWTATAWENAGWQVRDRVAHLFGSGFPKSLDVSKAIDRAAGAEREVVGQRDRYHDGKERQNLGAVGNMLGNNSNGVADITAPATPEAAQWAGWGTALKPACEDWWLLRKPLIGSVAANTLRHGCGGLNVDACRVGTEGGGQNGRSIGSLDRTQWRQGAAEKCDTPTGRWPANVVLSDDPEVEAAFAAFGERSSPKPYVRASGSASKEVYGEYASRDGGINASYGDAGSAGRFFFTSKADRADRAGSSHPTVKPTDLMRWLVRLVCPPGGLVLDPFAGSGSTGLAADQCGMRSVLIERDPTYAGDALRKIREDAPLFAEASPPVPDLDAAYQRPTDRWAGTGDLFMEAS